MNTRTTRIYVRPAQGLTEALAVSSGPLVRPRPSIVARCKHCAYRYTSDAEADAFKRSLRPHHESHLQLQQVRSSLNNCFWLECAVCGLIANGLGQLDSLSGHVLEHLDVNCPWPSASGAAAAAGNSSDDRAGNIGELVGRQGDLMPVTQAIWRLNCAQGVEGAVKKAGVYILHLPLPLPETIDNVPMQNENVKKKVKYEKEEKEGGKNKNNISSIFYYLWYDATEEIGITKYARLLLAKRRTG